MTQRVELSGTQWVTYTQGWDVDNRLIAITSSLGYTTTFFYDADGARVFKQDSNVSVFYIGNYLEKDMTHGVRTTYYYLGSQRVVMRVAPTGPYSGTLYWIHGDQLGSASLTTNITGTVVSEMRYYPFGETRWVSGTMPTDRLFASARTESASIVGSLTDMNAREYSPLLGRFLSADSIVPRPRDPQSLNRYSYARNSPQTRIDPDGHIDIPSFRVDPYDQNFDLIDRWSLAVNVLARVQELPPNQYDRLRSLPSFGVGGGNALHAIAQLTEADSDRNTVLEANITKPNGHPGFVDVVESDGSFYEIKPARWNDPNQPDYLRNQTELENQRKEYRGQVFNGIMLHDGIPKSEVPIDLAPYGAEGRTLVLNSFDQYGVIYYSVRGSAPDRSILSRLVLIPALAKILQELLKRMQDPGRESLPPVVKPQPVW